MRPHGGRVVSNFLVQALPVTVHPLPTDDPKVRQPDIIRARTLLGWEPTIDLATGLRETLGYFQQHSR
jgi:nucleoside-diphosphate-sugar epimerase